MANDITPTPALSYGVRGRGAAGGIMITSSHNPAQWNGVKYKAWYGGSGKPSIIAAIESYLDKPAAKAEKAAAIEEVDFLPLYLQAIESFADLDLIAKSGMKFAIDSMYGAGRTILSDIFTRIGVDHVQIRGNVDPLFPGINPEPIEPHIRALGEAAVAYKCDAGLCTDGDADRIGATDEDGNFVDPHKIFSVLLSWVLRRKGWPGAVTRAFNTTKMLDRICKKYGRELIEHGIGFKYVCDLMLEREIVMGGEESGGIGFQRHLPERDGLLNALLLANVMAEEKKTLGQLVADLQAEYGEHQYGRIDLHIPDDIKNAAIARARALPVGDASIRWHADLAAGEAGRRKVLPRQSRSEDKAERGGDMDSVPGQRNRATDADLYRIDVERGCGETARKRAGICYGKLRRAGSDLGLATKGLDVHSYFWISLERTRD